MRASATPASARPGSSSSARRRSSSPPASTSASASEGSSASRKRATTAGGCAPVNSAATWPSTNALTAGMPWMRKAAARRWLASVSTLASATLPVALGDGLLEDRRELAARPAPGGPEVDDDGELRASARRPRCSNVASVASKITLLGYRAMSEFTVQRDGVTLAGEEAGEGVPVVLLHGLTATRRYVVMGSRALERGGHRVVAYDARGHGALLARPRPATTATRRSPATCSPCSTTAGSSARCSPAPRWARTRSCASRSTTATASPALVVVTPAFTPEGDTPTSSAGTRSPRACAPAGWRASSRPTASPPVPEAWRETVVKVLHQRLAAHEHPEAVADALRARCRARAPFEAWDELAELELPARRRREPRRGRSRATRTRSASATRRRSPAPSCARRSRAPRRWRGRAGSSRR